VLLQPAGQPTKGTIALDGRSFCFRELASFVGLIFSHS
jgi:hypothetical protein